MTHHYYYEFPEIDNPKWAKTKIGPDATIYVAQLDQKIIDLMPSETDTFIDVGLLKLFYIRFRQRILKLIQTSRYN